MKSSLQFLASFVGVAGLSLSISLPAVAQTSPSRNSMMGSTSQATVSVPANSQSESIAAIVDESSSFELLNALIRVAALENPGLTRELSSGSLTIFAPTDEAFAALPPDAIRALVQPQNRDLLIRVLSNHIVPGVVSSSDIASTNLGSSIDVSSAPPSGDFSPNNNAGNVDTSQSIRPNSDGQNMGNAGRSPANEMQRDGNLTPPPGDFSPNDNAGNVDTSESIRPNSDRDMSNAGGSPSPANGMQREGNLTPPPGDFSPNDNAGNVDTSESIRPNSSGQSMNGSANNPSGVGSVAQTEIPGRPEATPGFNTPGDVQRGESNMGGMGSIDRRDSNQASEPPSGEQRPNENVGNVRGETLSPRGDRNSMGSSMSGASISAARVVGADIPASNGVIHAINRVILTPELQSELQEAIANLDNTSRSAR